VWLQVYVRYQVLQMHCTVSTLGQSVERWTFQMHLSCVRVSIGVTCTAAVTGTDQLCSWQTGLVSGELVVTGNKVQCIVCMPIVFNVNYCDLSSRCCCYTRLSFHQQSNKIPQSLPSCPRCPTAPFRTG